MRLTEWFGKKGLSISLYVLAALMLVSAVFLFLYRDRILDSRDKLSESVIILERVETVKENATKTDLTVRNLMISQGTDLQEYSSSLRELRRNYDSLVYKLPRNQEESASNIKEAIQAHTAFLKTMQSGDRSQVDAQFRDLPLISKVTDDFEKGLNIALTGNNKAVIDAPLLSLLILLIGIPILIAASRFIRNLQKRIHSLNYEIEESNRKYVFDPGDTINYSHMDDIKNRLIANLEKATNFIQQVSQGNYNIQWDGMNESNSRVNQTNIAGELIRMREQMKQVKEEDRKRIWITEGLSKFGEIIRKQLCNCICPTPVDFLGYRSKALYGY